MGSSVRTVFSRIPGGRSARLAAEAAGTLKLGGLVVFPTETVYGLAADAKNPSALRRLTRVKGRSGRKPYTYQVASKERACRLVRPSAAFRKLAGRFWPGPLTIVARGRKGGKIGLRIPDDPFALAVLKAFGRPLAVTSVNASGAPEIVNVRDLRRWLRGRADRVFWRPSRRRAASTVAETDRNRVRILREGRISSEDIFRVTR